MAITTLGLNIVSRMKEITPAKVLVSMTAETLFSLGYNTLLDLQERLRRCLKDFGRQLAPPSCMETVECLLSKRPVIIEGRFFTVEDFDTADDIVRYLEIMKEILRGFNFKADSLKASNVGAEGLDMENMLLTALALNVVTGKTLLRPLTKSEFERFIDTATDIYDNRRTIKPDFTAGLSDLLENILPELPRKSIEKTVGRLSLRLETEIQGLSEFRQIDPKYITCLIVET